ncbi:snare associated Golgi protein-domain-containing protein, partial [Catenaria anguillulae PL171]
GTLMCISLLATTAFPPMMGYSTVLYLCGYIYGFPWGWIPSFIGALAGSVLCFYLSRYYLREWAQRKLSAYATAKALKRTIEKRGLRLMILIRLAPYPFNFCNVLLATTNVSLRDFTLATAVSLPKTLLHTYIGASISSFA